MNKAYNAASAMDAWTEELNPKVESLVLKTVADIEKDNRDNTCRLCPEDLQDLACCYEILGHMNQVSTAIQAKHAACHCHSHAVVSNGGGCKSNGQMKVVHSPHMENGMK